MKKTLLAFVLISVSAVLSAVDFSKLAFQFDGGFTLGNVTRIEKESGCSNFVWQDSLLGAFFTTRTKNLPVHDISLRIEGFYPFIHQFNGMQQYPKQTILYGVDIFMGPYWQWQPFRYFRVDLTPGLHYMYQLSDEYHLNYLGIGLCLGTEYPVSKRWTILLDGTFTWDNANLGTNQDVQPFDYSWQWQTSLGVRYSKRTPNR